MATTTVNNIPINGSFTGAEPVDDGTDGVTYLSLTESGLVGGLEVQLMDLLVSPESTVEGDDGSEEVIPEIVAVVPGYGRPIADSDGAALAPTLCPIPAENYDDLTYGEFAEAALVQLYEDLCTAKAEETFAAIACGDQGQASGEGFGPSKTELDADGAPLEVADGADPGAAAARAFAHYVTMAIAGFINQLEFEIELHADTAAAAVASDTFTSTVSVAGSATAQAGTGTGVASTDISAAIEASTFTITISTK